jgi:hypothetical protein
MEAVLEAVREQQRPIRAKIGQLRTEYRQMQLDVARGKPKPARLQTEPRRPYELRGRKHDRWRREVERIRRENERERDRYRKELDAYNKAKAKLAKEGDKMRAEIDELQAELDKIEAEVGAQQAPLVSQRRRTSDEIASLIRQGEAVKSRNEAEVAALRRVPETERFRHGIAEWEGIFRTIPELEKLHRDTVRGIEAARRELEELTSKGNPAGPGLPADWRHPQQDRMDALAALLERARAARPKTAP